MTTVVEAEVFTSLPAEFRSRDVLTDWSALNRLGVPGDSFLEGPVFVGDDLFVTDVEYGRVFRVSPAGAWSLVAQWEGEPNGLKRLGDTHLLTTDFRNGLMSLEIATGQVEPYLQRRNTERFKGVNDLAFDSAGNLYFTDQGATGMHDPTGCVYRRSPEGRLDLLIGNGPSPNGLVLSPDERVLFVAMTRGNSVWRVPLLPGGSVAKVGQFFSANGPSGPDGLAMTTDGGLVVALPGRGEVRVLDRHGDTAVVVRSPTGAIVTNIAFGGPDRSVLYCTESETGTILRAELDVQGCVVHPGPALPAR